MKCKRVRQLMGAYLYGDLSPGEMMEVRVHTQACPTCAEDLASRGEVTSSLDNRVPHLTDEERQAVTWSVKGVVRAKQQESRPFGLRPVPAVALAMVLLIGVGIGALVGSHSGRLQSGQQAQVSIKPNLKITEDVAARGDSLKRERESDLSVSVPSPSDGGDSMAAARAEPPKRPKVNRIDPFRFLPAAVGDLGHRNRALNEQRSKTILPEGPIPVVPNPKSQEPKAESGVERLPEPTGLNDAQITAPAPKE